MVYFSKTRGGVGSNMMQSYMESRLQGLHDTSSASVSNYKDKVVSFFIGAFTIILLPYIHLGKLYTLDLFYISVTYQQQSYIHDREVHRTFAGNILIIRFIILYSCLISQSFLGHLHTLQTRKKNSARHLYQKIMENCGLHL